MRDVAAGAAIGTVNGLFVTRLKLPSFVVTLAGLIAWQGALLAVLGSTGTINLAARTDHRPHGDLPVAARGLDRGRGRSRHRRGLDARTPCPARAGGSRDTTARVDGDPADGDRGRDGLAVWVLNEDRGVPVASLILLGAVAAFAFLTSSTEFGRHVYAVGGNAEAARRAGIRVTRVRVIVFALASTLAAAGGILAASRLLAVNQSSGAGDLLLLAIAGPVIAGVSLFGGRGSVWAALLGALVIGSISNGMDLLALESSVKFMITGGVLLAAVSLDAATRLRSPQR